MNATVTMASKVLVSEKMVWFFDAKLRCKIFKVFIPNKHLKMQKHDYRAYLRGHSILFDQKKKKKRILDKCGNRTHDLHVWCLYCSLSLSLFVCVSGSVRACVWVDVCFHVCVCVLCLINKIYIWFGQSKCCAKKKKWSPRNPDFLWRGKQLFLRSTYLVRIYEKWPFFCLFTDTNT
jgi:hypothetical protein